MYQVHVIKSIFETPLYHILGSLKSYPKYGKKIVIKIECFISFVHPIPLPTTMTQMEGFFPSCVRVNSIETGMYKAPDYNEHPAVFT